MIQFIILQFNKEYRMNKTYQHHQSLVAKIRTNAYINEKQWIQMTVKIYLIIKERKYAVHLVFHDTAATIFTQNSRTCQDFPGQLRNFSRALDLFSFLFIRTSFIVVWVEFCGRITVSALPDDAS